MIPGKWSVFEAGDRAAAGKAGRQAVSSWQNGDKNSDQYCLKPDCIRM